MSLNRKRLPKPVRYLSATPRRTINTPDEATEVIVGGKKSVMMRSVPQIMFSDGSYLARYQDECEIIESQPEFGKKLGTRTDYGAACGLVRAPVPAAKAAPKKAAPRKKAAPKKATAE